MSLPVSKKYLPMEAQPAMELPAGPEWHYEPKWDGFRCLAFRDDGKVELVSKSQKPLTRYFPELVAELSSLKAKKFVLDGEIVIPVDGKLSFDDLLQRIHPAASRVEMLSRTTPAQMVVFDLLLNEKGESLVESNLEKRRPALEKFYKKFLEGSGRIVLSRKTLDREASRTRSLSGLRGRHHRWSGSSPSSPTSPFRCSRSGSG